MTEEKQLFELNISSFPSNRFLTTIFFITHLLCMIVAADLSKLSKYITNYLNRKMTLLEML